MAVLNPPRAVPGLARSIVNFLLESRKEWDEASLVAAFNPGVNDSNDALKNTIAACRAIRIITSSPGGKIEVAPVVTEEGQSFDRTRFRKFLRRQVFDLNRDGNPWAVAEEDAHTSGARDLARALAWFLAQDAQGAPINWTDNVEQLQKDQFRTADLNEWVLRNDTRWGAFSRWAQALGFAVPSVLRTRQGLVPLPTMAVLDTLEVIPAGRVSVSEFFGALSQQLPVLPGGIIRHGLVTRLGADPDPGIQANAVDSSLAQVLRILETRKVLAFESLADAEGVLLSSSDQRRITHVILKGGKKL
ncbi:protein DpdG [Gordonia sp. NPDC062954]|uniref:protein DpdG n=1 Tax=Gordonia sp. NPDC062954 TaxID=3364003 RepID=UPI0037C5BF72